MGQAEPQVGQFQGLGGIGFDICGDRLFAPGCLLEDGSRGSGEV